jgi:hypothetical protein
LTEALSFVTSPTRGKIELFQNDVCAEASEHRIRHTPASHLYPIINTPFKSFFEPFNPQKGLAAAPFHQQQPIAFMARSPAPAGRSQTDPVFQSIGQYWTGLYESTGN